MFYVTNKDAPGNPWGPFETFETANKFYKQIKKSWPNDQYELTGEDF